MGVPIGDVTASIQTQLTTRPESIPADRWRHIKQLYTTYGHVPLWLEADGFSQSRSKALLRAVVDVRTDALRLDAYPLEELVATVGAVQATKQASATQLASADVLLTATYVELAEDLLTGQVDPKSIEQDWHIATGHEPIDSAVARSLRDPQLDSAIARMRPRDADYDALRRSLVRFQSIVASGGWAVVPAGKALKPRQTDKPARLAALRARLRVEGFGAPGAAPDSAPTGTASANVYNTELAGLVADFQARHGIAVDSALGAETMQSLNVPAQYRLAQIAANLERYRWLPRSFGGRYIIVNVPAFRLEAHDSTGTLEMKVIVGEEFEGKTTPVFADSMETVVFRPYWNITPDIQEQETAPKIAADAKYMDANDLEYFKDGGETRIRQKPGPKNSLGLVKFLFPNAFNIYLHDTPDDALFAKDVRAFSHGCIRLEKPEELAQWALGWDAVRVDSAMQQGPDNQSTKLAKKIPVYIVYATAYERDGQLYFGNDLYSRDAALVEAVTGSIAPPETALRSLEALRKLVQD
ncbi:L,D-transpeptidase family protein [Gemmatimonas sp.]|uniref:L,D-transpeptidase family protein n=1 Tax=Gemmatimonas sp. TaxID=1962908 RepID=UPI00286E0F36|nr:L,D-transpeptidase family protein [Gemmatimonas sp.]